MTRNIGAFAVSALLLAACATGPKDILVPVSTKPKFDRPVKPEPCEPKNTTRPEFLRCQFIDLELLKGYCGELEAIIDSL